MLLRITGLEHDGLIRYFFFFNRERLIVASPKALAEVLVSKNYIFEKPDTVRGTLGRILGYGILLSEGDEHRVQRKNLMPAFAFRHVKDLYPTFWKKAREVTQAMTAACGDATTTVLEVNGWASRCTLDIIGVAGMGVDFGAIQDKNNPLAQTYSRLARPTRQAKVLMVLGTLLPGWLVNHLPVKRNVDIKAAAQRIRSVCRELIRDKKQRMANKEPTDLDILSVALESGLFTDEQLVDQLMTFLAAGHDTTASALTWSVYLLSRHPEKQQRLRDEVRAMLPSANDEAGEISAPTSTACRTCTPCATRCCGYTAPCRRRCARRPSTPASRASSCPRARASCSRPGAPTWTARSGETTRASSGRNGGWRRRAAAPRATTPS